MQSEGNTIPIYYCDVNTQLYETYQTCITSCYRNVFGQPLYMSVESLQFLLMLLGILIGVMIISAFIKAIL